MTLFANWRIVKCEMTDEIIDAGLEKAVRDVVRALIAMETKLSELEPIVTSFISFASIHGMKWPADKNWVKERADAQAALVNLEKLTKGNDGDGY